jgi:hypothetical protein
MSSKDLNLVVTLGGRPVPDQALGIRAFKDACLASSKTPPPQAGEWTLTAPDGRTWKADSPLKCCGLEQRERVPANVALARIVEEMERFDAEEAAKAASAQETGCARGEHDRGPADICTRCGTMLVPTANRGV